MSWILSYWTLGGITALLGGVALFLWISGLMPVAVSMLSTPAGRKGLLIAAGGFLLWIGSAFFYQKGKKQALDQLKANSDKLEKEREVLDNALKDNSELDRRADRWTRN